MVFGRQTRSTLEIRSESSFVVLYGPGEVATATEFKGKLVLDSSEAINARRIKISLVQTRKVQWLVNTVTPTHVSKKYQEAVQEIDMIPMEGAKKQAHTLGAGPHEWDFKFEIPGNVEESVEGLTSYVVYDVHATVERSGVFTHHLSTTKHIRIIRALDQDQSEYSSMEQVNEDLWANKIAYRILVPQRAFIVGTTIPARFELVPLKKGLKIGKIKMMVDETVMLQVGHGGPTNTTHHCREFVVADREFDVPEGAARLTTPAMELAGTDALLDECYKFETLLDLPRSLKYCRPDCETRNIKIGHRLRILVNLHNPEGHVSQLHVKNGLILWISPNLAPNDDQSISVNEESLATAASVEVANQTAPPLYGEHHMDSIFIDPSEFMSQPGSSVHTPARALSRSPSSEALQGSIDAVTEHGASASALHSRLANLRTDPDGHARPALPSGISSSYIHSHHSSDASTPHNGTTDSSTTSEPSGSYFPNPESVDYNMEALQRTPSYGTAVRTPIRTPISSDLPTYEIATSRPSSPVLRAAHKTSPGESPDPLRDETLRNTQFNSRRGSPSRLRLSESE